MPPPRPHLVRPRRSRGMVPRWGPPPRGRATLVRLRRKPPLLAEDARLSGAAGARAGGVRFCFTVSDSDSDSGSASHAQRRGWRCVDVATPRRGAARWPLLQPARHGVGIVLAYVHGMLV